MTFYELYKKIDTLYPKSLSCEWDNDGIMCMSNPDNQVKKVLISLDITEDVVDFAIKEGFDTIASTVCDYLGVESDFRAESVWEKIKKN